MLYHRSAFKDRRSSLFTIKAEQSAPELQVHTRLLVGFFISYNIALSSCPHNSHRCVIWSLPSRRREYQRNRPSNRFSQNVHGGIDGKARARYLGPDSLPEGRQLLPLRYSNRRLCPQTMCTYADMNRIGATCGSMYVPNGEIANGETSAVCSVCIE